MLRVRKHNHLQSTSLKQTSTPSSFSLKQPNVISKQVRQISAEAITGLVIGVGAFGFWAANRYQVALPNEYLVRTGLGLGDELSIKKNAIKWPFQTLSRIHMTPKNYSFELRAMSNQKMEFILPGVFTIGPKDDKEALSRYCKFLLEEQSSPEVADGHMDHIIRGIIEGETRVLAAGMSIEEIFNGRAEFKQKIITSVQQELDQFGLVIFNANIKELHDAPGSEYFFHMRQKILNDAATQAKINIAEAQKAAQIGEKERQALTRQRTIEYESNTVSVENDNKKRISNSNSEFEIINAENYKKAEASKVEAQRAIEQLKIGLETEKIRNKDFAMAQVNAEVSIRTAEAQKQTVILNADAQFYAKQKEADATKLMYQAHSEGLSRVMQAFGGDSKATLQYLLMEKDIYTKLAEINAKAVQGLNPKITIWDTRSGPGTGSETTSTNALRDIFKMLPPLVSTIDDQTSLKAPDWLMKKDQVEPPK